MEQTNANNLDDYQGPEDEIEDMGNDGSPKEEIK